MAEENIDKAGEAILQLVQDLRALAEIVDRMEVETLVRFQNDCKAVDEVEDAFLEPYGAYTRKKMRRLTIEQIKLICELKGNVALIHEAKRENAAAMKVREETNENIRKGIL
jgi:hypothetical protein